MYKKIIPSIVLLVLILISTLLYTTFKKQDQELAELTKVKIAYLPLVQGSPLYLAIEKGYFLEAGIDVELVTFQSPAQIIDALLQGNVDFTSPGGATGIVAIADFKNPNKLKIYALAGGDESIQNDSLLVQKESTIKSVADLKGKKLGILTGSIQWQTIAKDFLEQNNLTFGEDVMLVDLPIHLQAQALASGQVDALIAVEPIPTVVKINNLGKEFIDYFTTKHISNPFYGGAGIVRVAFAKENPETTKKVLSILDRAIDEVNKNPELVRPYLKKYLSIDEEVIARVPISRFKMYNDLDKKDISATQQFMDIFTTHNVINGKIDFKKLIYSPSLD